MRLAPEGNEYLHGDVLGSITLAKNRQALATQDFDAWSGSRTRGESCGKFGYTGHEIDTGSGLIHFKACHHEQRRAVRRAFAATAGGVVPG